VGDSLVVGRVDGPIGSGRIIHLDTTRAHLDITWQREAPPALPLTLIVALPRPKMLKRILQTCATMGVKQVYFINAWKVEKSYWSSPWLSAAKIRENLILGLEQAQDTRLPEVHLRKLFKPFVEDELPGLGEGSLRILAHPGSTPACPIDIRQKVTLIIGPEGGFTPYEVAKLDAAGFTPCHLGARILRVDTAVPVLLSRLFPATAPSPGA
jgi:RsmE family RNA methyltransferase